MTAEQWRVVPGAPDYEVSDQGRVARRAGTFRCKDRRPLRPQRNDHGYLQVGLSIDGRMRMRKVHQLVVDAFIRPRRPGEVPNHLNGDKADNRLSNLEITDRAGNTAHAAKSGLIRSGSRHWRTKLTDAQVQEIRERFALGEPGQSIADAFGITRSYAYHIKQGLERAA